MDQPVYKSKKKVEYKGSYEELVNPETGEIIIVEREDPSPRYKLFLRTNPRLMFNVTMRLNSTSLQILMFIMNRMSFGTNICSVRYTDLETDLSLAKSTVTKCMTSLQSVDCIRMYRVGQWMVNPNLAVGCKKEYVDKLVEFYFNLPQSKERRSKNNERSIEDVIE